MVCRSRHLNSHPDRCQSVRVRVDPANVIQQGLGIVLVGPAYPRTECACDASRVHFHAGYCLREVCELPISNTGAQ